MCTLSGQVLGGGALPLDGLHREGRHQGILPCLHSVHLTDTQTATGVMHTQPTGLGQDHRLRGTPAGDYM